MQIPATLVKELRERTGAGVMDCKRALEEANGDLDKATENLRQLGLSKAAAKANRVATQGLVEAYIHAGGRIGAMVELSCETDFVARTDGFKGLARELAMQVAATRPSFIDPDEMPPGDEADPAEACLLKQPYIREPARKVEDLISDMIAQTGENIKVRRFTRFELGT